MRPIEVRNLMEYTRSAKPVDKDAAWVLIEEIDRLRRALQEVEACGDRAAVRAASDALDKEAW